MTEFRNSKRFGSLEFGDWNLFVICSLEFVEICDFYWLLGEPGDKKCDGLFPKGWGRFEMPVREGGDFLF